MSSLELKALSKAFATQCAVDSVDLCIPAGMRTAIVGPSGSGKTTLLRLIAGFEVPDQGTISLAGTLLADGLSAVPAHRRGIGYVPQDGALFPHLDVAANIGFALTGSATERHRRVRELAAMVQLDAALLSRWPHALSGGQQQRVALARALAQRPRLMLLDEPFSALDSDLRTQLRAMVRDLLDVAGIASILVTHDQHEALSFAQHLVLMRGGRLLQAGAPQDLYRSPVDPAAAAFLGEALVLLARLSDGWARCELGTVKVNEARRGGVAKIMLRPEQLRLLDADDPRGALATVVRREYSGSGYRLAIRLQGSGTAVVLPTALDNALVPGATVRIGAEGQAHVFLGPSA